MLEALLLNSFVLYAMTVFKIIKMLISQQCIKGPEKTSTLQLYKKRIMIIIFISRNKFDNRAFTETILKNRKAATIEDS